MAEQWEAFLKQEQIVQCNFSQWFLHFLPLQRCCKVGKAERSGLAQDHPGSFAIERGFELALPGLTLKPQHLGPAKNPIKAGKRAFAEKPEHRREG